MGGGDIPNGLGKQYPGDLTLYVTVTCIVAAMGGLIFAYDIGISGALINGFAQNVLMLIVGRILLGFGIGFANQWLTRDMMKKLFLMLKKLFLFISFAPSGESNENFPPSAKQQLEFEKSSDGSVKSKATISCHRSYRHQTLNCSISHKLKETEERELRFCEEHDIKAVTELRRTRAELNARTRLLEKEKHELQSTLEMELDRRSRNWILKLEKYQSEQHRLRERARELAEHNVALQREIFSCKEREADYKSKIASSDLQLGELSTRFEELRVENKNLQQDYCELQEKYRTEKEAREFIQVSYEEKDKECRDLHRSVSRLQRTCSEPEKAIDGTQNALDSLSCATHKMKDLELQMIMKDGNINQLQNDLQECSKELAIVRGLLPKVIEERDQLWEEVKQHTKRNMLLNLDIEAMKKKVEALDEDILFKEGQITILKDSVSEAFNHLGGPDWMD